MSKIWVRVIAFFQIVGGVFGVLFVVFETALSRIDSLTIVLAFIAGGIYVLSLIAGIALWREHPIGRVASIVVQAIQLPKYFSQALIFMFSFGFDAYVYGVLAVNASPILRFEVKFLAFNQLSVGVSDVPVGFGVSIPACIFLTRLITYRATVLSDGEPPTPARTEPVIAGEPRLNASHLDR